jgi:disulfide oxidoreductase YuzD
MCKKGDKRGSHVGMILSFVIFITFIIFLYSVFQPAINIEGNKKETLEYLEFQIIKNVSANFTTTSVQITGTNPAEDCVTLQNLIYPLELIPPHIKIKNENGVLQEGKSSFTNLRIERTNQEDTFFRIYHSPKFPLLEEAYNCTMINEGEYQRGLIKVDNYIFKESVESLKDYYETNYEELKEELKLSPADEFWFGFTESDGTKIEPEQEVLSENVYADEIPVQYIDENINIQSGYLNVKVW